MLGHADISTTQIYIQVSLRQLRAIHAPTHPGTGNESRRARAGEAADGGGQQRPAAAFDAEVLHHVLDAEAAIEKRRRRPARLSAEPSRAGRSSATTTTRCRTRAAALKTDGQRAPTYLHLRCVVYTSTLRGMGRRSRQRQQTTATKPASKPERMARVAVADQVWADFRALAAPESIAAVLGGLVEREVDRYRARQLKAGQLDDPELVDALERARELHENLTVIVARLERRLDRQPPAPVDPGR